MTSKEILDDLAKERDRLIDRAHRDLAESTDRLAEVRHQLNLAANQAPYSRCAGNNALFRALPIDLSVVNAAFDAIERVAEYDAADD